MRWDDLNARARGLSTHLLTRHALEALARSEGLGELAAELSRRGYLAAEGGRVPADDLELAARRVASARLATLVRWLGRGRESALAVLLDDEDRRSVRAIVRGAVQHAAAEVRLAGLVPTPALPERALEELAHQATPRGVACLLSAWKHPYGGPLLARTGGPEPDLFRIESDLNRAFARRALQGARAGGSLLVSYVRDVIDIENAYTALLLAGDGDAALDPDVFVAGGWCLTAATFAQAMRDKAAAGAIIARAFRGTTFAAAFAATAGDLSGTERAVLRGQIAGLRKARLERPLTVAPLIEYMLRLRAELMDLRWTVWGVSLNAPPAMLGAGLVTAP